MPAQHRDVSQPSAINDGIVYRPNPRVYEMGIYDLGVNLCLHQLSYFLSQNQRKQANFRMVEIEIFYIIFPTKSHILN